MGAIKCGDRRLVALGRDTDCVQLLSDEVIDDVRLAVDIRVRALDDDVYPQLVSGGSHTGDHLRHPLSARIEDDGADIELICGPFPLSAGKQPYGNKGERSDKSPFSHKNLLGFSYMNIIFIYKNYLSIFFSRRTVRRYRNRIPTAHSLDVRESDRRLSDERNEESTIAHERGDSTGEW